MTAKKVYASPRPPRRSHTPAEPARIVVENVNHPGTSRSVDAASYQAMRRALLKVLPLRKPGFTQAEMLGAVRPRLSAALFPGGARVGWWMKTVQLDLEAKGIIAREKSKPLRWHRS